MLKLPSSLARTDSWRIVSTIALFALVLLGAEAAFPSEENDALPPDAQRTESRRATGVAYIDLSSRVRARLESNYTDDLTISDQLARPYVYLNGPDIRSNPSLESRIALTRSLSERIEVGVVWGVRSSLGNIDLFDIERQTVGAMIRIVP